MSTIDLVDQEMVRRRDHGEDMKILAQARSLAAAIIECDRTLGLPMGAGPNAARDSMITACDVKEDRDRKLGRLLRLLS